jgi:glycosyltransferase involved in cell wall biosynthesis
MADYLFSQDLFICPLRVASGMRNKVLEAMASGMTVISTTIGVEGLEVEPERHYLRADSEEEFVQQTERALKNPDLRNKMGLAGREYTIRNHSGQAAGEALLSLYGKLIRDFARSPQAENRV